MNLSRMLQQCVSIVLKPPSQQRLQISVQKRLLSHTSSYNNTNTSTNPNSVTDKERIDALHRVFPKNTEEISELILSKPEVLNVNINFIRDFSKTLRKHGTEKLLEHKDIIELLENYPEVFSIPIDKFETQLVNMIASCGRYDVPWKTIILENADIVVTNQKTILKTLENLSQYFTRKEIYSLIYNNPHVFRDYWEDTEQIIKYLMHTMNVSLQRIAKTPGSLMQSTDFYDIRYQFLQRSGNYIHPDANQLGSKPLEAQPAFFHICSADDRLFIKHCAPQMSLEELNTFKTLHYLESRDQDDNQDDLEDLPDDEEDGYERGDGGASFGKTNRVHRDDKKENKRKRKFDRN